MATEGTERFCRSMERSTGDGFPSFFLTKDMTMTRTMKDMTATQLKGYMRLLMDVIRRFVTPDTSGYIVIVFSDSQQAQYGGTLARDDAPAALREVADRLEEDNRASKAHLN